MAFNSLNFKENTKITGLVPGQQIMCALGLVAQWEILKNAMLRVLLDIYGVFLLCNAANTTMHWVLLYFIELY